MEPCLIYSLCEVALTRVQSLVTGLGRNKKKKKGFAIFPFVLSLSFPFHLSALIRLLYPAAIPQSQAQ